MLSELGDLILSNLRQSFNRTIFVKFMFLTIILFGIWIGFESSFRQHCGFFFICVGLELGHLVFVSVDDVIILLTLFIVVTAHRSVFECHLVFCLRDILLVRLLLLCLVLVLILLIHIANLVVLFFIFTISNLI